MEKTLKDVVLELLRSDAQVKDEIKKIYEEAEKDAFGASFME